MQCSVEKIPLPDNHFDFFASESVLAFVNKPMALKEIFRLLKSGGRFIAIEQTINGRLKENEENEIKQFYGFDSLSMEKDWMALLQQAGFDRIRIEENTSIESVPDIPYADELEAELYEIMDKHSDMMTRYKEILGYRIYSCTK